MTLVSNKLSADFGFHSFVDTVARTAKKWKIMNTGYFNSQNIDNRKIESGALQF
jgi:hypothetical protein